MPAGTDFWTFKADTDFVVRGSAFAPNGRPTDRMTVSAQIGSVRKDIAVYGRRAIVWKDAETPKIELPEQFTEIPLTYENAFGGIDWRVEIPDAETLETQLMLDVDHPGMYPRNPFGKGYLVVPGEVPEMEMPNLEHPRDLLTANRLVIRDPRLWYQQPLPWCYDWVNAATFPRYSYLGQGVDAWFPGPEDDRMPEVAHGLLPRNYRSEWQDLELDEGPHRGFYQEASHGFILPDLKGNEPVGLSGMHPEGKAIVFDLPNAQPTLEFEIERKKERVQPNLHSVVCYPADEKFTMLYGGVVSLPRPFLPGIHKTIPISVRINGDEPIHYETPPTMKEQLDAAMADTESDKDGTTEG
jgi:hypothetical protein